MLKIEIKGVEEFNKAVNDVANGNKKELNKLLAEAAINTHSEAVKSIQQGGRSGAVYKRRSVTHQASSPGEPPKTDTGNLVTNITMEKTGNAYTVGSRKGAPYGFWLEFGTSRMKARAWLQPAFDKMVKAMGGRLGR